MDIIDNLIYASVISQVEPNYQAKIPPAPAVPIGVLPIARTKSNYFPQYVPLAAPGPGPMYNYPMVDRMTFCSFQDPAFLERAIQRHWYDVDDQVNHDSNGVQPAFTGPIGGANRYVSFTQSSTYHLITAYLLENTRMLQIFERLLEKCVADEEFGIPGNNLVFNWMGNTERLFFKNDSPRTANLRSLIRPNSDDSRRNAYWRMLGIDLAFGGPNSQQSSYSKAKTSNQQFIPLFEKFLAEIWQGYINRVNAGNVNTSDVNIITDLAQQLRELLEARRGDPGVNTYANLNLSREEFSATLITGWFHFIISDNTPVVTFLNCQSSSIGERLLKIGAKVGIPAHGKCQSLFEMAAAAGQILNIIEIGGVLDNAAAVPIILASLNVPPPVGAMPVLMQNLLTVINNWERATGHKIKNREANINGTVRVAQIARGASVVN